MQFLRMLIALCVLGASGCVLTGSGTLGNDEDTAHEIPTEFGIWITRWDYQSPEDIERAIADAASIGMTDVYWQVRGQGDAYYPSNREPWGIELLKYNPNPPSFDPLKIAIQESKKHNLRLHAWVNVMPLWRGKEPPTDRAHMYHTNPEWRLRDSDGKIQDLHDGYVVVNPVLKPVQDHIVSVIRDIVDRYDIDGIHLDYIRFLSDEIKTKALMPGDPVSRSMYAKQTGKSSVASEINPDHYRSWIRSRITNLVQRIDRESIKNKPGVRLTAAVWRHPDLAHDRYLQDGVKWANDGTVDTLLPMIYTDKHEQYTSDISAWMQEIDSRKITPGIGIYKHTQNAQTAYQVSLGHPRRFALFAYGTMFESPNPDQPKDAASVSDRTSKRNAMKQLIERIESP